MEPASLRHLHRATGLVPLGCYLLFHAWEHWPVRSGRDALFARLARTESAWLEGLCVLVPLLVHAGLGLSLARTSVGAPPYVSPAFRRLQVATGIVSALFLLHHLVGVWLPRLREDNPRGAAYDGMLDHVAGISGVSLYAIGLAAVCTHFGQGLGLSLAALGPRHLSPQVARVLGVILGVLLWLVFVNELATYATNAPLL